MNNKPADDNGDLVFQGRIVCIACFRACAECRITTIGTRRWTHGAAHWTDRCRHARPEDFAPDEGDCPYRGGHTAGRTCHTCGQGRPGLPAGYPSHGVHMYCICSGHVDRLPRREQAEEVCRRITNALDGLQFLFEFDSVRRILGHLSTTAYMCTDHELAHALTQIRSNLAASFARADEIEQEVDGTGAYNPIGDILPSHIEERRMLAELDGGHRKAHAAHVAGL